MGLPRNNELCTLSWHLKRNMTEAERKLWNQFLKEYPFHFSSQKIIGSYIVDFFCNKVRLSIELDGSQHYEPKNRQKDEIRRTYLEMLEVKELRFPNSALWENFEGVCEVIHNEVQKRRNDVVCKPLSSLVQKK